MQHLLLDLQLLGIMLRVLVKGKTSGQKEVVASVAAVNGCLSIQQNSYNKSEALPTELVSPKHPNLTHDNRLLVIINSKHCGKYI